MAADITISTTPVSQPNVLAPVVQGSSAVMVASANLVAQVDVSVPIASQSPVTLFAGGSTKAFLPSVGGGGGGGPTRPTSGLVYPRIS